MIGIKHKNGGRKTRRLSARSEINVTPFVDVMLVLLIIFMITAPLLTVGVPVDLPKSDAPAFSESDEPLVISIKRNGALYIQETKVKRGQLIDHLQTAAKHNQNIRIFIRAHKNLRYQHVVDIMGAVTNAGFTKVALITETKK